MEGVTTRMVRQVDEDLQRKMIGISLDKIRKIPVRVGISHGKDKIEAIKGAIAGGLVNVLVTDVPTAELFIKMMNYSIKNKKKLIEKEI